LSLYAAYDAAFNDGNIIMGIAYLGLAVLGMFGSQKSFKSAFNTPKGQQVISWAKSLFFGKSYGNSGSVKPISVSSQKMHQLGKHFNKHGKEMGFTSKAEYDAVAREFAISNQNNLKSQIIEGIWNEKGSLNGTTQRAIIYDGKTVIIDVETRLMIDYYVGSGLRELINTIKLQ